MGCSQVVRQRTLTPLFVGSSPPIPVLEVINIMNAQIEFIENIKESTIPIIKLTKSKSGQTGTATFLFLNPLILYLLKSEKNLINGLYLVWDNKKIVTKDLSLIFKNGQPYLIKAIFIFKNNKEWFNFLKFMDCYSKETGLTFFDSNT